MTKPFECVVVKLIVNSSPTVNDSEAAIGSVIHIDIFRIPVLIREVIIL